MRSTQLRRRDVHHRQPSPIPGAATSAICGLTSSFASGRLATASVQSDRRARCQPCQVCSVAYWSWPRIRCPLGARAPPRCSSRTCVERVARRRARRSSILSSDEARLAFDRQRVPSPRGRSRVGQPARLLPRPARPESSGPRRGRAASTFRAWRARRVRNVNRIEAAAEEADASRHRSAPVRRACLSPACSSALFVEPIRAGGRKSLYSLASGVPASGRQS